MEFSRRKVEQVSLIYAIKSTVTNDCHPKVSRVEMWVSSPEPYDGACDRIEHFLPQMEYAFDLETGPHNMSDDASWGKNLLISEESVEGSWAGLYTAARLFIDGSERTTESLKLRDSKDLVLKNNLASTGKLTYWQYLLAFAFGV